MRAALSSDTPREEVPLAAVSDTYYVCGELAHLPRVRGRSQHADSSTSIFVCPDGISTAQRLERKGDRCILFKLEISVCDAPMSLDPQPSPHPRYRLLARIGKGGMGEVFRAYDRLAGQVVALKRVSLPLRPAQARQPREEKGVTSLGEAATLGPEALHSPQMPVVPGGPETVSCPNLQALLQEPELRSLAPEFARTVAASSQLSETPAGSDAVILAEAAQNPTMQSLCLHLAQEFRTLAGLRHPNIVSVLDYGFDRSQQPYFTMELLEGGKALDEAARNQPFAVQIGLLLQILQALTYLHRRNVLHRDLKPGNILVIPGRLGPQVKLLDFGLALLTLGPDIQRAEIAGTIGYIAPEMLVGALASEASDLFAVGVIAYELLVGSHPLGALPIAELVQGFLGSAPIFREDARLSPALSAVLGRALCRDPSKRYVDAAVFAYDLARAAGRPAPPETTDIRESFLQAAHFQAREAEMDVLLSALHQAMCGRGQVLLIGGESGVGKSRLLDEFRAQALVRGARVLRGQTVREGGGAFLVLRDVLAPLCLEQPLDQLQSGVLLQLIPRLPNLLERMVAPAPDVDAKSAQDRALAVIERVLLRAASTPLYPLVVLLEDLQWAGSEVLLLLERLSELSKSRPLLVIGSYRDDERPELPVAVSHAGVLKLKRFSKESVNRMAIAMLGSVGQRDDVMDRLYQETEGNALFLVEVLRALAEDAGQLAAVGSRELPARILSGGIRAVLESRLGRVPDWARPMLERAAVAGRRLDLRVLGNSRAMESHSATSLEAWLAACADLSILEVSDQAWRFSHDKLRECLLEQIEQRGELSQLHRDVAVAIERAYGNAERDAHAAALAFHFAKAGLAEQAARYGLRAGERALNGGAPEEAVEQLQATLRYQAKCSVELFDGVAARRLLCTALYALGRMEECTRNYRELYAYIGHPVPSHAAGRVLSSARFLMTHATRQVFPAARITPEVSRTVMREMELLAIRCGPAFIFTGEVADMLVMTLLTFVFTKQLGNSDSDDLYKGIMTHLLSLLPLGLLKQGGPEELPDSSSSLVEAHILRRQAVCFADAGRGYWAEALRHATRGAEDREVAGDYQLQMGFQLLISLVQLYSGDFEQARINSTALLQAATRFKNEIYINWSLMCLASLDLSASQPHRALERLLDMHATAVRIGDALNLLSGSGLLARAYLMLGERAKARYWAEQAIHEAQARPLASFGVLDGCLAPAEVLSTLAAESLEPTERSALIRFASRGLIPAWHYASTFPIGRPRANLVTGIYAHMRGQIWLARSFFQRALSAARQLAMPYEVERAKAALASLAP